MPINSWLHTSNDKIDYAIYESDSSCVTFAQNKVIASKELTTEALISLAITQLDKYVKLRGLTISHYNQNLTIERISTECDQALSVEGNSAANLYVVTTVGEIPIFRYPRVEMLFLKIKTRIVDVVRYRFKRYFYRLDKNPRVFI